MSLAGTPRNRHEAPEAARRRRWLFLLGLVSVLAATTSLVGAGHRKLSVTVDEPAHVLAGMEWLERGTYAFEPQHPPLA